MFLSGSTNEAFDFLRRGVGKENVLKRAVLGPVRAGYGVNQFMDNMARSAVYIGKRQKGQSVELATREALRAMGDFTKMNDFERNVIRRVVPFYAWQKHIT